MKAGRRKEARLLFCERLSACDFGRCVSGDERSVVKPMTLFKLLTTVACVLMLGAFVPMQAVADQAQYIYDDLGWLSQVIDRQGNVATYTYDAVGNGSPSPATRVA